MQLADKSFFTKDINRKSEEKIHHLQQELEEQIEANSALRKTCVKQSQDIGFLEEQTKGLRLQVEAEDRNRCENAAFERERELAAEAQSTLEFQLRNALEDNEKLSEARSLLQERHNILMQNMEQLRQESRECKNSLGEMEKIMNRRQQLLAESEALHEGTKKELAPIKAELHELKKQLQDAKRAFSTGSEDWKAERRNLEIERDRFQKRASALQDMLDKFQDSKGSSTSQEVKLREAFALEERRFLDEESTLKSLIKVLQADLLEKGDALGNVQSELADTNNRLGISEQSRKFSAEKVQGLEDEIEVLQCSIEECNESRRNLEATAHNAESQHQSNIVLESSIAQLKEELASVRQENSSIVNRLTRARSQLERYDKKHSSEKHSSVSSELELRAEVIKLQRKLMEAGESISSLRMESREREDAYQRKIMAREVTSKLELASYEQREKQNELNLFASHKQLREMTSKKDACEETCARLGVQIQNLEKDILRARATKLGNSTVVEERKDLHELLRKAKLEAEDLQSQLQERKADLQRAIIEGNSIRRKLGHAQTDQARQKDEISALLAELETLQRRHEISIESLDKKQREWEEERAILSSKARFSNMPVSNFQTEEKSSLRSYQVERLEAEQRHAAEIRGLTKQIQWMKARCSREESFRAGLIFEKRFLLLQVDMFNAW